MRRLIIGVLCWVVLLLHPAAAHAAELRITPPSGPPSEDVSFTLTVSGRIDSSPNGVRVIGELRPVSGLQCAATPTADPGTEFLDEAIVNESFSRGGSFIAADPGAHLACAWVVDASGKVIAGPAAKAVQVRLPNLGIGLYPERTRLRPGSQFSATVTYSAEAPRRLLVVVAPGTTCETSPDALLHARGSYAQLVDLKLAILSGEIAVATSPRSWGTYVLCGFFVAPERATADQTLLVETGARIQVGGPARKCRDVGGRRGITEVRVGGISCNRGRSLARRWGAGRRTPRFISDFYCERDARRRIKCQLTDTHLVNYGEVTFRYRR
jgi:hypothetical protein